MIGKLLAALAALIIWIISTGGYAGIVIAMAIESACIPLPSEVIMPFSGYLASIGRFSLWGTALAGAIGNVAGSTVAYLVGRYGGREIVWKYGRYVLISHRDVATADRWFSRYGQRVVFGSRLLPVIRTFISLPAGIAKMRFIPFVVYTFLGSLPWCYALAYVGYRLGERWDTIGVYFHRFDTAIGSLLLLAAGWWVWRHWRHLREA
ncbi:MAG: DedA family protein [Deltaproteobacteria bacterium]|nr:DedA family protein [Deltaproteobacteria bacterium]